MSLDHEHFSVSGTKIGGYRYTK